MYKIKRRTGMAYRTTFMHEYGPDDDVDTTAWNKDQYYSRIKM